MIWKKKTVNKLGQKFCYSLHESFSYKIQDKIQFDHVPAKPRVHQGAIRMMAFIQFQMGHTEKIGQITEKKHFVVTFSIVLALIFNCLGWNFCFYEIWDVFDTWLQGHIFILTSLKLGQKVNLYEILDQMQGQNGSYQKKACKHTQANCASNLSLTSSLQVFNTPKAIALLQSA